MKTLRHANDREEIAYRLAQIRADSQRLWGKMTAHQMVCHLSDSFRGVMGEKSLAANPGKFGSGLMKWGALYLPVRWLHGVKTMPDVDQQIGGTPPGDFATDMRDLRRLFERFTIQPRDFTWAPHPFFGDMTETQWMRWGYLHMDHHLRQFGA
jgi:hypothetical protein